MMRNHKVNKLAFTMVLAGFAGSVVAASCYWFTEPVSMCDTWCDIENMCWTSVITDDNFITTTPVGEGLKHTKTAQTYTCNMLYRLKDGQGACGSDILTCLKFANGDKPVSPCPSSVE